VCHERQSCEGGELEVDLVLRDGLFVSPLSAEALSRIRSAAEAEWRANVGRRPGRWLPYAAAASLLALVLTGVSWFSGPGRADHGDPAARLVRFEAPGVLEVHTLRRDTSLTDGTVLRTGRTYRVTGQALLDLEDSGNLRVASDSEFAIVARDVVRLNRARSTSTFRQARIRPRSSCAPRRVSSVMSARNSRWRSSMDRRDSGYARAVSSG
jgi:hypothetical protein